MGFPIFNVALSNFRVRNHFFFSKKKKKRLSQNESPEKHLLKGNTLTHLNLLSINFYLAVFSMRSQRTELVQKQRIQYHNVFNDAQANREGVRRMSPMPFSLFIWCRWFTILNIILKNVGCGCPIFRFLFCHRSMLSHLWRWHMGLSYSGCTRWWVGGSGNRMVTRTYLDCPTIPSIVKTGRTNTVPSFYSKDIANWYYTVKRNEIKSITSAIRHNEGKIISLASSTAVNLFLMILIFGSQLTTSKTS